MLEIVVFDKYLIRGLEKCYAFSKVRDGREPVIIKVPKAKKVDGIEVMVDTSDYSNFGDECYPSTFANCLSHIIDEEVRCSDISGNDFEAILKIAQLISEINTKISRIDEVFQAMNKRR